MKQWSGPETSYGQGAQQKQTLTYISIGAGAAGLALIKVPIAGAIAGVISLGASLLAETIQVVEISLRIPDTTTMRFADFVSTVHAAITPLSDGLGTGRENAAKDLRDAMEGADYDLEERKTLPNHHAPGSELLE